jgi:hypothetical protein
MDFKRFENGCPNSPTIQALSAALPPAVRKASGFPAKAASFLPLRAGWKAKPSSLRGGSCSGHTRHGKAKPFRTAGGRAACSGQLFLSPLPGLVSCSATSSHGCLSAGSTRKCSARLALQPCGFSTAPWSGRRGHGKFRLSCLRCSKSPHRWKSRRAGERAPRYAPPMASAMGHNLPPLRGLHPPAFFHGVLCPAE